MDSREVCQAGDQVKYTEKEYKEFSRLVRMAESQDQMDRINARLEQPKFIQEHGTEKCDVMYERLCNEK